LFPYTTLFRSLGDGAALVRQAGFRLDWSRHHAAKVGNAMGGPETVAQSAGDICERPGSAGVSWADAGTGNQCAGAKRRGLLHRLLHFLERAGDLSFRWDSP